MPATGTFTPSPSVDNAGWEVANDPSGHDHPCIQAWVRLPDGTKHYPRFFLYEHNSAGWRGFTGNGADTAVFETDPANGRLVIQAP